jgi:nitrosocyanin
MRLQKQRRRREMRVQFPFSVLLFLAFTAAAGGWSVGNSAESAATSAAKEFTLVTAVVADKANIWLPSTLVAKAGDEIKLNLRNVSGADHGFAIDELGIKEVIPPGETRQVTLKLPSSGVLRYYCHLHPGHISGQILVYSEL